MPTFLIPLTTRIHSILGVFLSASVTDVRVLDTIRATEHIAYLSAWIPISVA